METQSSQDIDILQRIQKDRRDLLDLSARNRLINTPRDGSRGRKIEIVDERSDEVFRLLVREGKAMSFRPGSGESDSASTELSALLPLGQPDLNDGDAPPDPRHTDLQLQTRLSSETLQDRLLKMYYDAETYEQEQGVSILYLGMGFLKWYESDSSDKARYAPLLLVPANLNRNSALNRFSLSHRDEDLTTNLSLQSKLSGEFAINLPDVPELDELAPEAYFDAVVQAVTAKPRWEVLRNDMVLWFFSFAKYLMYRDLDPNAWPAHVPLGGNPILRSLLGEGFVSEPALCGDDDKIDPLIPPATMTHITDADSSQAVVIEEVRQGRHLVVQGPPGTGKSQTITNLIATAVKQGKKVLFVAEKLAALEVVHSRLKRLGLDAICLELHSNKANKKAVLAELKRTLDLGRPKVQQSEERVEVLQEAIERLNRHAEVMNTKIEPAGVTPFQIIGRLAQLRGKGVEATNLTLTNPEAWDGSTFRLRLREIKELQTRLEEIGPPAEHPWWAVNRTDVILPSDVQNLQSRIAKTVVSIAAVLDASVELANLFDHAGPDATNLKDAQNQAQLAIRIVKAPTMDRQAIANPVWESRRDAIARLVEKGQSHAELLMKLQGTLAEVAWGADLSAVRRSLAGRGRSIFRWFHKDYRDAVAALQGVLRGELPRTLAERLEIVDAIIGAQTHSHALDDDPSCRQLGQDAFGTIWNGSKSDWPALAAILRWNLDTQDPRLNRDCREILSKLERPESCQAALKVMKDHLKSGSSQLQEIVKLLNLDVSARFGRALYEVPIADLITCLRCWQDHPEDLSRWIGYQGLKRRLAEAGLGVVVQELHEGRIDVSSAVDVFKVSYYQSLIRNVFHRHPELSEFDGRSYEQGIGEFRALDQECITKARTDVAVAHYDAIPRHSSGGEMNVVWTEILKQRKHKPIRKLIKEAGSAVLAIKPVFMMSPISIAQYLEPGTVTFDLLLIDEASQVGPVDAFGAMARARQVVVVGDDRQLPPSRFFSKMFDDGDPEDDADDSVSSRDLESILGLCVAGGMSQRMLRWHYRSRHHSLIAVSNHEFYDDRLYVVHSPTVAAIPAAQGLHFRHVKDGLFDRGRSATNRVEARAIAEAVIEHATHHPNQSLGVGAFSVSQRDAIRDELEVLQRAHPELTHFFSTGLAEPFFVKNLENIQGDERDVIFISVGYARDASGYMAMNFGPLSTEGGERRLNVLISRARERCEVFSSITADDIDLERARSRGAAAFKTFLRYAATGVLDSQAPTGLGPDSDFETQVAQALERLGHEVHCQVGSAGFRIDLAVVDPAQPGRYLLGIECDGATYHSSRSARDRDRLREAVLRDRGWRIHRVWSTDWFHRPDEQVRKLVQAIEAARLDAEAENEAAPVDVHDDESGIERTEPIEPLNGEPHAAWVTPYVEARLDVPNETPIHETSGSILTDVVTRVVELEGPIHRDEIARRITSLWGLQRTGARISEAVSNAIDAGLRSGVLRAEREFVTHAQQTTVPVRRRSDLSPPNLKKPEMVPPAELRQAIRLLVTDHFGILRDDLPAKVARILGFKATSTKLRDAIQEAIISAIEENLILIRDEKLFIP